MCADIERGLSHRPERIPRRVIVRAADLGDPRPVIRRPTAILLLLTGLNLINFLDRLVVSAVLPKLQAELGLSNFVGGLLATVFLVGYFATSPVFGALGDRVARKGLIAIGVLVWSLATIGSGLATGALSLIAARALVGVGEASYTTLAPTIIDDITPPSRKGVALAVFYIAAPFGAALGYVVGGLVEARYGWRSAFLVAGAPGIVLALVCLWIAEPARKPRTDRSDVIRDIRTLATVALYRQAVIGFCAYSAAIGAFSFWAPKFLYARYQLPLATANTVFGAITVVAGVAGTLVGGAWGDAVQRKLATAHEASIRGLLRICALAAAAATPLAVVGFLLPTATGFFVLIFLCIFSMFLVTSPVNVVCLQAVPGELRASAMALQIFAAHLLGDLWSPAAVGLLADHLPIEIAMLFLPLAVAVSAGLWWPRRVVG